MSVYFVNFTASRRGDFSDVLYRGSFYIEWSVTTLEDTDCLHHEIVQAIHDKDSGTKACFIDYTLTKL